MMIYFVFVCNHELPIRCRKQQLLLHENRMGEAPDKIQQRLTDYACGLHYEGLAPEVVHAVKVRVIDTLGALIGGYFGESCAIARNVAAQMPDPAGASIIGTRMKTTPDMAAFVNAITACHADVTDSYHWPGSAHGHPSNLLAPVLAAAEHAQVSGREFITGVALGYEVYLRFSDVCRNPGFDNANFACLGAAVAAGKLLKLSSTQLSHCIAMAAVANNILKQAKTGMFYTVRAGQAGRAGVYSALLARAGMEGPHQPFEGKAGWCDHVIGKRFALDALGGSGTPFRILHTQIKNRPCVGNMISSVLAAEKAGPFRDPGQIKQVTVETYKYAKELYENYGRRPDSQETAYHCIPYLVAVTLVDGTVSLRSYEPTRLADATLHELMAKIEVVENQEFTSAYDRETAQHRARVTVVTASGETHVGETGGDEDDLSATRTDAQIEEKFRALTDQVLSAQQVNVILHRLWRLEELACVADIPPAFVLGG